MSAHSPLPKVPNRENWKTALPLSENRTLDLLILSQAGLPNGWADRWPCCISCINPVLQYCVCRAQAAALSGHAYSALIQSAALHILEYGRNMFAIARK